MTHPCKNPLLDAAVQHYYHLVRQGRARNAALAHAVQRFGVTRSEILREIHGHLADEPMDYRDLAITLARAQADTL